MLLICQFLLLIGLPVATEAENSPHNHHCARVNHGNARMTAYAINPLTVQAHVQKTLGARAREVTVALGEVCAVVNAADYFDAASILRDAPHCEFNQLIDLCAVDFHLVMQVWAGG